jgi:PKD repeat protein
LGFAAQPNLQSHVFTKAGNNNVTVTVTDNDGASTTKSIQIAVANVAPTISTVNIPTNINEGSTVQLTATATDPSNDTLTPVSGQTATHTFADNGDYNVVLTVTDKDGATTTQTVIAKVDNVAPVILNSWVEE